MDCNRLTLVFAKLVAGQKKAMADDIYCRICAQNLILVLKMLVGRFWMYILNGFWSWEEISVGF